MLRKGLRYLSRLAGIRSGAPVYATAYRAVPVWGKILTATVIPGAPLRWAYTFEEVEPAAAGTWTNVLNADGSHHLEGVAYEENNQFAALGAYARFFPAPDGSWRFKLCCQLLPCMRQVGTNFLCNPVPVPSTLYLSADESCGAAKRYLKPNPLKLTYDPNPPGQIVGEPTPRDGWWGISNVICNNDPNPSGFGANHYNWYLYVVFYRESCLLAIRFVLPGCNNANGVIPGASLGPFFPCETYNYPPAPGGVVLYDGKDLITPSTAQCGGGGVNKTLTVGNCTPIILGAYNDVKLCIRLVDPDPGDATRAQPIMYLDDHPADYFECACTDPVPYASRGVLFKAHLSE